MTLFQIAGIGNDCPASAVAIERILDGSIPPVYTAGLTSQRAARDNG